MPSIILIGHLIHLIHRFEVGALTTRAPQRLAKQKFEFFSNFGSKIGGYGRSMNKRGWHERVESEAKTDISLALGSLAPARPAVTLNPKDNNFRKARDFMKKKDETGSWLHQYRG